MSDTGKTRHELIRENRYCKYIARIEFLEPFLTSNFLIAASFCIASIARPQAMLARWGRLLLHRHRCSLRTVWSLFPFSIFLFFVREHSLDATAVGHRQRHSLDAKPTPISSAALATWIPFDGTRVIEVIIAATKGVALAIPLSVGTVGHTRPPLK